MACVGADAPCRRGRLALHPLDHQAYSRHRGRQGLLRLRSRRRWGARRPAAGSDQESAGSRCPIRAAGSLDARPAAENRQHQDVSGSSPGARPGQRDAFPGRAGASPYRPAAADAAIRAVVESDDPRSTAVREVEGSACLKG
ncbi:MAG: hypothetical protein ABSA65_10020 [Acidimicrobiales bacterium]